MTKCFLILFWVFSFGCSTSYHPVAQKEKYQIMQDYVLYKSLAFALQNDSVFNKDATVGVYFDLASPEIAIIQNYLDTIAQERADKLQPIEIADYQGKRSIFKDLINMYNDPAQKKELLQGIKKELRKAAKAESS